MSEKFVWENNNTERFGDLSPREMVKTWIIKAITNVQVDDPKLHKQFMDHWLKDAGGIAEISFTVNGFELPFLAVMESVANTWDKHVQEEAQTLFNDKAQDLHDLVDELSARFQGCFNEAIDLTNNALVQKPKGE